MVYDIIGVGLGPSNLSLAALLKKVPEVSTLFLEKKSNFSWHKDFTLKDAKLQVSYLKDLVSTIDPTSELSFLQYLVEKERIFEFLHRRVSSISRMEFNDYYVWASDKLSNTCYNKEVVEVLYNRAEKLWELICRDKEKFYCKNLVVATGPSPKLPGFYENSCRGKDIMHSSDFLENKKYILDGKKRIAIVGGGQSGAEIFYDLISVSEKIEKLYWISDRPCFSLMEDSSFVNEFYSPRYAKYFFALDENTRQKKLAEQHLSSNGISEDLLNAIYDAIYEHRFIKTMDDKFAILIDKLVEKIDKIDKCFSMKILNNDTKNAFKIDVDTIIFATGYAYKLPKFLESLLGSNALKELNISENFEILTDQLASENKIFIQGGLSHLFGHSDNNLSLNSWRSATIINKIMDREIYNCNYPNTIINHIR
jgi:lysine N6-hydroxylase